MEKRYKEPIESEMETTVNVLYGENCLSLYTNKPDVQRKLNRIIGEPEREYVKGKSITGSTWKISLDDKTKISKLVLKVNIFEV